MDARTTHRQCMANINRRILGCLFVVIFSFHSTLADESLLSENLVNEDYLLIVKVEVEGLQLTSELFIYSYEEITLIPLQPLFDALRFAIKVNPETQQADGWYIKEDNQFYLDKNHAIASHKKHKVDHCYLYQDGFDLYSSMDCLNDWFPIDIQLSLNDLTLKVASTETLPLIAKLQREKSRKKQAKSNQPLSKEEIIHDQYQWLGPLVADVSLGYRADQGTSGYDYNLQSAFDFLTFETHLNLSQIQGETTSGIFTLSKQPTYRESDFALGMNYISLGDIYGQANDLILNGTGGLGFTLSANRQQNVSGFSSRIIEGYAKPGWEVELYRNNTQVDFSVVDQSGRYRFEQVDIEYGENIFDIKLFGPQGQIVTRRESINVGRDMLKVGEFTWLISHYDQAKNALGFNNGLDLGDPYVNTTVSMSYGLTKHVSIGLTQTQNDHLYVNANKASEFTNASVVLALPWMNVSAEVASDNTGGSAYNISFQGKIFDYPTTLSSKHFDALISDRNSHASSTTYRLSSVGSFKLFTEQIQHGMRLNTETTSSNTETTSFENRFSFQLEKGFLTNNHTYQRSNVSNEDNLAGYIKYTSRGGESYKYRLQSDYSVLPNVELTTVNLNVRKFINTASTLTSDFSINIQDSDLSTVSLSFIRSFSMFKLNLSAQAFANNDYAVLASMDFSFISSPFSMLANKQVDSGRIGIRAFLDENLNNQFDPDETPLPGIKFKGNNRWSELSTDSDGQVMLTGLSSRSLNKISVISSSIEDPFWKPKNKDVHMYSHAGGVTEVDYPIYQTLEIEGQLNWLRNNKVSPASGVKMQLIDEKGKVESETYSEFDGVYVFTGVSPGKYTLMIPREIQTILNIEWPTGEKINADASQSVIYIDDISIRR